MGGRTDLLDAIHDDRDVCWGIWVGFIESAKHKYDEMCSEEDALVE